MRIRSSWTTAVAVVLAITGCSSTTNTVPDGQASITEYDWHGLGFPIALVGDGAELAFVERINQVLPNPAIPPYASTPKGLDGAFDLESDRTSGTFIRRQMTSTDSVAGAPHAEVFINYSVLNGKPKIRKVSCREGRPEYARDYMRSPLLRACLDLPVEGLTPELRDEIYWGELPTVVDNGSVRWTKRGATATETGPAFLEINVDSLDQTPSDALTTTA